MRKIRNMNVPGECTNGYAGPVESGRGGSRKSPVNFTGTSPPASAGSLLNVSLNSVGSKVSVKSSFICLILTVFLFFTLVLSNNFITPSSADFYSMDFPRVGQVSHSVEGGAAAGQNSARVNERPVQPPVAEPVEATKAGWFGTLGDGQFSWSDIVYAMALPFAVFTGCKTEPESPPVTETKHLTAPAGTYIPSGTLGFTVPNFNNLSDMWPDFNVNDITWTFSSDPVRDLTSYASSKTPIQATAYTGYEGLITITQVFQYKGTDIGQRTIMTQQSTGSFTVVAVNGDTSNPNVIPALNLAITRQVN